MPAAARQRPGRRRSARRRRGRSGKSAARPRARRAPRTARRDGRSDPPRDAGSPGPCTRPRAASPREQSRPRFGISRAVDFELSDEQREIQELARDFAQAEIEPNATQWDREHAFPRDLLAKLGELGLLGVCVPEEYGGAGADFLSYILVLEELSRGDAGVGVTVAVHTSACTLPILAFGTDEQRARFVPPLARGQTMGADRKSVV